MTDSMDTASMENLVSPPQYEDNPFRLRENRFVDMAPRSGKFQHGSPGAAKERSRTFCLREQLKDITKMITILVGSGEHRYNIPRELAIAVSPFFAAALNGKFAEGREGVVRLVEMEPKIFEHIALWMYQQQLDKPERTFFKDGKPTYFTLLDIYSAADMLCIEGLRNAVVDLMADLADQTNSVPTPMDTNLLYENIRENAPIRALVLDLFAYKKTDNLLATHPDPWHPTFLRDLTCKLKRPGITALTRHDLHPFRPKSRDQAKACEVCKIVPGLNAAPHPYKCGSCCRAFCGDCVHRIMHNGGGGMIDWSIAERECKPWSSARGRCEYHEHTETEECKFEKLEAGLTHSSAGR